MLSFRVTLLTGSAALLLGVVGCRSSSPPETVAPQQVMNNYVASPYQDLRQKLVSSQLSEAEWRQSEKDALRLREACSLLEQAHKEEIPSWDFATSTLNEGSVSMIHALRARDIELSRLAFENVNRACSSCHQNCQSSEVPW